MRIISRKILSDFYTIYKDSEHQLYAWYQEVSKYQWNNPNELKLTFRNSSIINDKRVVFNICGNKYRLIVDIEYKLKIIFIVWIGNHKEYDNLNVKEIKYVKNN
jgi:mRNA interferase HigB